MLKRILGFLILLFALMMVAGCAATAINQGNEDLKMKHYYAAAKSYLTALSFEANNKEALSKLAQIASPAYDEKLAQSYESHSNGNLELELKNYEELAALIDGLNKYVGITFPVVDARKKVLELRTALAEENYVAAQQAFASQDYPTAIFKYKSALSYVRPYKDSAEKLAESFYRSGKIWQDNGNYRQAAGNYMDAHRTVPGYKDAYNLAVICKSRADELDARDHYMKGLELGESDRYREAIRELKEALSFVPHYKNAEELVEKYNRRIDEDEAEGHYQRGVEHMARENYAEARKELEQALVLVPDYRDARELLKRAKQHMESDEARDHYEKGLKFAADGDYQKASEEFETVLKIMPSYREAKALAEKYKAQKDAGSDSAGEWARERAKRLNAVGVSVNF